MENCNWCRDLNKPANYWVKKEDQHEYISIQKFCSLKCKTQYENKYSITWKKKTSPLILIIVIIIAVIFFIGYKQLTFNTKQIEVNNSETRTNNSNLINQTKDEEKTYDEMKTQKDLIEEDLPNNKNENTTAIQDLSEQNKTSNSNGIEENATINNPNTTNSNNYRMVNYLNHQSEIEKATEMLKQNKSIDEIEKSTTLTRKEIRQLRRKL